MKIESIEIENFRGVLEKQVIDSFPPEGLIGMDGPSGSGKSTVLYAIATLFDICPFPASKNQSIYTKKKSQIVGTVVDGENRYAICRGKENSVHQNGVLVADGSTEVSEYIKKKMFPMASDVLRAITFRIQGEGGTFTSVPASSRQKFLSQVLGLNQYELAIKKLKDERRGLETALIEAKSQVEAGAIVLRSIGKPPDEPPSLDPSIKVNQGLIIETKNKLEAAMSASELQKAVVEEYEDKYRKYSQEKLVLDSQIRDYKLQISNIFEQLRKEKEEKLANSRARLDRLMKQNGWLTSGKEHKKKLDDFNSRRQEAEFRRDYAAKAAITIPRCEQDLIRSQGEAETLLAQITQLKEHNTCPTCKRLWAEGTTEELKRVQVRYEQVSKVVADMTDTIKDRMKTLEQHNGQPSLSDVESEEELYMSKVLELETANKEEMRTLEWEIKNAELNFNAQVVAQSSNYEELIKKCEIAKQSFDFEGQKKALFDLNELDKSIAELKAKTSQLRYSIKSLQDNHERQLAQWGKDKEIYAKAQERYDESIMREGLVGIQIKTVDNATALIKAFLVGITEDVLQEVSYEANLVLAGLKNTSSVNISFPMTEVVNDSGSTYSIDMVIEKDGLPFDPRANLSGGQQSSLHLAVDLALAKILTQRQGTKIPGFIMFDESFEGHSGEVKEECMEILTQMAVDKQIFIVDHSSEFKDYYRYKVIASNTSGRTELRVA